MDKFKWKTQVQDKAETSFSQNIREVQFGDGYKQVSEVGINSETEKCSLSWSNNKKTSLEILSFLRGHITKSFQWKNTLGEIGLYRVVKDSIHLTPVSNNIFTISAEFEKVHSS